MRRLNLFISCIAIGVTGLSAMAQDAPRGGRPDGERPGQPGAGGPRSVQLSPEKAKAAWELTATGVAKRLGLSEDQAKGVVKAYTEARTSQAAAAQKVRDEMREKRREGGDEGGDPRARAEVMAKAMEGVNKTEREKLTKALTDAVGAEQAGKAAASLGLFAPNWDRMVDVIGEFKLEAKKQQDALNAVEDFIVAQAKLGRDADREERQAVRQKLTTTLGSILTEEQMAKFEQSTGGRRGGGEGGGRPGRGGQGGGGS